MKKANPPVVNFNSLKFTHSFNQGDERALTDLFEYLYAPLCFFADQIVKDKPCAEDLAKDTFVKLWLKRADFPTFPQIKTFLYQTTRNAALNILRHQQVKIRAQKELIYLESLEDDHDMLGLIIKTELMAELIRAKRCLSPQQKRIIDLKYYEGLTNEKVAVKLGVSVTSVKTQIARAIAKLKHYFKNNKEAYILIVALLSSDFDLHNNPKTQAPDKISNARPDTNHLNACVNLRLYGRKVDFRQPYERSNIF